MPKLKVVGECEGCHKEKEIVNIGGNMAFCKECMYQFPEELWHKPSVEY